MKIEPTDILIVLRPPAGERESRRTSRHKLLLKRLGRGYGFQCLDTRQAIYGFPQTEKPPEPKCGPGCPACAAASQ